MELLLIAALTLLASVIGTISGFGISTIMVSSLVLFLPLPTTLLLVAVIHWFNDVWKLLLFKSGINWKIILSFGLPGIIASYFGALLVFKVPADLLTRLLGIFLIFYTLLLYIKPTFKIPATSTSAATGGALSGFLAGIIGISGGIRAAFLSAFNLPKEVYIFTTGAIAFIIDVVRIGTYLNGGIRIESSLLFGLLVFIPTSFAGAALGKKIVSIIPQQKFRLVIAFFILLASIKLVVLP